MRKQIVIGLSISAALMILTIAGVVSSSPQLQQSGGSGGATNISSLNGNTISTGNGTSGAGTQRVTIASDSTGQVNAVQSGAWTVQPGNTANTTPWLVKMIPSNGCGTTIYDSGATVVPNTSTALTSTTTCVDRAIFNNTTGSPVTITLQDNQGTPKDYLTTYNLPANSQMILQFGYAKFTSGIKWQAGTASAVNGQIVGYQ